MIEEDAIEGEEVEGDVDEVKEEEAFEEIADTFDKLANVFSGLAGGESESTEEVETEIDAPEGNGEETEEVVSDEELDMELESKQLDEDYKNVSLPRNNMKSEESSDKKFVKFNRDSKAGLNNKKAGEPKVVKTGSAVEKGGKAVSPKPLGTPTKNEGSKQMKAFKNPSMKA